ncbi:hypothetical protein [Bacillus mesophilum]|uniref:Myb-like domain-containing protein n=1 Tax=Bacillus mesophilum TaxID=1071718 RepID=A0A7V7UWK9_9BACI|nr:hypothetical protein [Bacillus mesophilum]KAB2334029.1 hypothetical protein F7732_08090 [Bacillus mesophilum]
MMMTVTAKQKWTHEDDELLRETVLEYTGNGDPKAAAFKTAAAKLNRSAAACSNRWFHLNKEQAVHKKNIHLSEVIAFLEEFPRLLKENEELKSIQAELSVQNESLQSQLEEKRDKYEATLEQHEEMTKLFEEASMLFDGEIKRVVH